MKTKLLIIAFLIVSLLGAFALKANAQDSIATKQLIADETWLSYSKTGCKITTYSESVFQDISLKFGTEFRAIHIYYKHDRNGQYKEWNILIPQTIGNNIKEWAKNNL